MTRKLSGVGLRAGPEGDEGRNQQPEQSFHEEEKKTPEAEPFYPLRYAHTITDSCLLC